MGIAEAGSSLPPRPHHSKKCCREATRAMFHLIGGQNSYKISAYAVPTHPGIFFLPFPDVCLLTTDN